MLDGYDVWAKDLVYGSAPPIANMAKKRVFALKSRRTAGRRERSS